MAGELRFVSGRSLQGCNMCPPPLRLIKHTKQLLEENEEKLCIKVLQTLREMMTKDRGYGEKVPPRVHPKTRRRWESRTEG